MIDPLLLCQQGLAQSHRGELLALQTLAAARDGLRRKQDAPGLALTAAALLITGQSMSNYRRFREHAEALAGLRDGSLQFVDRTEDLLAQAGLLCALLFLNPGDNAIDGCVARIMALLESDIDVNLRYAAGRLVIYYTEPREMRELGQRVYGLLQPLSEHPALTAHRLGRWLIMWIRVTANAKDATQHRRACAQARELAEQHGEPEVVAWMLAAEIDQALRARDHSSIERALASIDAVSDPANLSDMARLSWLKGRCALASGDGNAAVFHAEQSRRYAEELEFPPPMLGVRMALEAQAKLFIRDYAGAREQFKRTSEIVAVLHAEEMRDMIRMVDAYEACELRRPDARTLLATAFAAPRARQFYDTFDTNPPFGATMCALALEHDVEVEFVRRIIELHGMAAPANAGRSWPWPVCIHTLGDFELSHASGAVAVHAATQKKPLELLKALIALGGHGVDKSRLANLLWPEVESDTAAVALDKTISRLRKMLAPNAIRVEDGRFGLDPDRVWVDVWAFDRDVEALQTALRSPGAGDDDVAKLGQRVLSGYRGAFLENEEPQRWMLAARDRWRSRFLRSLADAGRYWERDKRWSQALELYERGIEVEPLAEELYRPLMHCHLAQGQTAQAARVYRRCREALSAHLGIAPSAETEGLFKSIYKDQ
jgi:LuxR family transcriptional regulator, maltose regulon positive regulatory protein